MEIKYIALDELTEWPGNPKTHDLEKIVMSIKRFGFVSPIIVDEETKRIIAGHGRVQALQDLKALNENVPGRIELGDKGEWKVPAISGVSFKNAKEAKSYLLADNRLTELGGWDEKALFSMLAELVTESEELLDAIGFDTADYDILLEKFDEDMIPVEDRVPEEEPEVNGEKIPCPKCGFLLFINGKLREKYGDFGNHKPTIS